MNDSDERTVKMDDFYRLYVKAREALYWQGVIVLDPQDTQKHVESVKTASKFLDEFTNFYLSIVPIDYRPLNQKQGV